MVTIRKMNADDHALYMEMTREFYHSDAVLHPIPTKHCEIMFAEMIRSDVYAECFFFEEDGKCMGYAQISKTFSQESGGLVVWVEELYMKKDCRGKGVGSMFLKCLEQHIPASRYRLEVEPDNDGAMRLYQRMGYEPLPYLQLIKDIEP